MDYKEDLYWGNDIVINDKITIHQPTVGEIMNFSVEGTDYEKGEAGYYKMVSIITSSPADYDVQLDSVGVRYEDVDPMDFFFGLTTSFNLTKEVTRILFGDLDFMTFERLVDKDDATHVMYINADGVRIDNPLYRLIVGIVRDMHNLKENVQSWGNEASRAEYMKIQRRRMNRHKKKETSKNVLLPVISMLVCQPGFKYDREQIRNINIYFFYDQLRQVLHNTQVDHLMTGVYVGLIDTSKLNLEEQLNFIRKDT